MREIRITASLTNIDTFNVMDDPQYIRIAEATSEWTVINIIQYLNGNFHIPG